MRICGCEVLQRFCNKFIHNEQSNHGLPQTVQRGPKKEGGERGRGKDNTKRCLERGKREKRKGQYKEVPRKRWERGRGKDNTKRCLERGKREGKRKGQNKEVSRNMREEEENNTERCL